MSITEELKRSIEAWKADDPDAETVSELGALLQAGDADGLEDRFRGSLQFGTAGSIGFVGLALGHYFSVCTHCAPPSSFANDEAKTPKHDCG